MRLLFSFKTGAIAVVTAVVLLAVGVYAGAFLVERDGIRRGLDDSILQIALNLEAIKYIREGKTTNAIDLINANSETKLLYIMHYDDLKSEDPESVRRRNKVLSALSKERTEHHHDAGSFKDDPEWQQYQRDLDRYLMQGNK